jgi:subtilisin family serine protease
VYGWNFVDNNNVIVNLADTPPQYDQVIEFFRLMSKYQAYGKEGLTASEFQWLKTHYYDKKFMAWVSFAGGWAHGTHVAGIIAKKKEDMVGLKAVKHIPTGKTPKAIAYAYVKTVHNFFIGKLLKKAKERIKEKLMESNAKKPSESELIASFKQLGQRYISQVKEEAAYVAKLDPRIVNCSFGTDNKSLLKAFRKYMTQNWGYVDPTDEEVQHVVNLFVKYALLPRDKVMFGGMKHALVFIAAGNSAENNDNLVISPNNVDIPNKVVVAATNNNRKLAAFSCYGKNNVDLATPGVNIYSTLPNGKMGYMSGTSMASPMAAGYAAMVLYANPDLTPIQLKKILMGTVDKKDWLKGKVKSGGILNVKRAIYAANLVKKGESIADAIKKARKEVQDMLQPALDLPTPKLKTKLVKEMYFSTLF